MFGLDLKQLADVLNVKDENESDDDDDDFNKPDSKGSKLGPGSIGPAPTNKKTTPISSVYGNFLLLNDIQSGF